MLLRHGYIGNGKKIHYVGLKHEKHKLFGLISRERVATSYFLCKPNLNHFSSRIHLTNQPITCMICKKIKNPVSRLKSQPSNDTDNEVVKHIFSFLEMLHL